MRIFIAVLCISLGFPLHGRAEDFWSQKDKQLHMASSFALMSGGYTLLRFSGKKHKQALWMSAFLTFAVGTIKEITDPRPDIEDMHANLIGLGSGLIIPVVVHEW
jgi:hypothetical protein